MNSTSASAATHGRARPTLPSARGLSTPSPPGPGLRIGLDPAILRAGVDRAQPGEQPALHRAGEGDVGGGVDVAVLGGAVEGFGAAHAGIARAVEVEAEEGARARLPRQPRALGAGDIDVAIARQHHLDRLAGARRLRHQRIAQDEAEIERQRLFRARPTRSSHCSASCPAA